MSIIDTNRHISVFSNNKFEHRIDVIGAGATGSRIALGLAKLGLDDIHVWDFDIVEEHNIANQTYGLSHVGMLKVEALQLQIKELTNTNIIIHNEEVNGDQELGEVIFLLTDTMSSRKEIWEKSIKMNMQKKLMIETRMGSNVGRIYTIDPCSISNINQWEKTLCDDDVAEVSACGASISVGPTADILSGFALWQMIRWFNENETEEEVIFSTEVPVVICNNFC